MRTAAVLLLVPYAVSSASCTLCEDESSPKWPDKVINIPGLPNNLICRDIYAVVPLLIPDESSNECRLTRRLSSICGCPRKPNSCSICPDGSPAPNAAVLLPSFAALFATKDDEAPSCAVVEAYAHSFSNSSVLCLQAQQEAAAPCGCVLEDNIFHHDESVSNTSMKAGNASSSDSGSTVFDTTGLRFKYFGAEAEQLRQLMRIFRVASILSVAAAFLVILDNLWNQKRLKKNIYNQLILTMAGFDLIFGIAIALHDIPRPTYDILSSTGERGNDTTCKIQGWFTQWGGLTSLFLNVSLSTCTYNKDLPVVANFDLLTHFVLQ